MITNDELRGLIELSEKATPGPWATAGVDRRPLIHNTWRVQDARFLNLANFIDAEDAAYITAACNALPALARELIEARKAPAPCVWTPENDDWNTWDGACGIAWCLEEGTPASNDMHFCPKCGHPITEREPSANLDDEDLFGREK